MAELADALDLGSSGATRTGSIPASRTKIGIIPGKQGFLFAKNNSHFEHLEQYYKIKEQYV